GVARRLHHADRTSFLRMRHVVSRESLALVREIEVETDQIIGSVLTEDGGHVVSLAAKGLTFRDLETGRVVATLEGQRRVTRFFVTNDRRRVISASEGELAIWDVTCRQLTTLEADRWAVSLDGTRLVAASQEGTLKVYDLEAGAWCAMLEGHTREVRSCAITRDGRRVVSASADRTLKVWDLDTGCIFATLEGHAAPVMDCAVSPDGRRVVSVSADGELRVWDLDTGSVVTMLEGAHVQAIAGVAHDGQRVAGICESGTLKIWGIETGRLVIHFERMFRRLPHMVLTPRGWLLVAEAEDDALEVWNLDLGQVVTRIDGARWAREYVVTPSGQWLVARLGNTVKVWSLGVG